MLWACGCQWVSLPDGGHVWPSVHAAAGERGEDGWVSRGQGPQSGAAWRGTLSQRPLANVVNLPWPLFKEIL